MATALQGGVVIELRGDLDRPRARSMEFVLTSLCTPQATDLTVDLRRVGSLDVTFADMLSRVRDLVEGTGHTFELANVAPGLTRLLQRSGLPTVPR